MECSLWLVLALWVSYSVSALDRVSEVLALRGTADYKTVNLRWEYPQGSSSFQVHYCELEAWGRNRCKTRIVDGKGHTDDEMKKDDTFSADIEGLRMSTNYSFTVRPTDVRRVRYLARGDDWRPSTIFLATKGFSARAITCLPEASEVEVLTGPYFSGRIGVEGSTTPSCSLEGDPSSPRSSYILRVSHTLCPSTANSTSVATFVLVQENLPILTHSTRRFLVVCTFQPETLTVRAGINLPHTGTGAGSEDASLEENEPDSDGVASLTELNGNDVHALPLQQASGEGRSLKGEESEAGAVLTTVTVVVILVAVGLAVWWFAPYRISRENEASILTEEPAYDTFENGSSQITDVEMDIESDVCTTQQNPIQTSCVPVRTETS